MPLYAISLCIFISTSSSAGLPLFFLHFFSHSSPSHFQQLLSISISFSSLIVLRLDVAGLCNLIYLQFLRNKSLFLSSSEFSCTLFPLLLCGQEHNMASQIFTSLFDRTWHTHIIKNCEQLMFLFSFLLSFHFLT